MTGQPPKVLFICIGNACRSPMAEAIARKLLPAGTSLRSAGLAPLGHVPAEAIAVLEEAGFDASNLTSDPIAHGDLDWADFIIDLSGYLRAPAGVKARIEHWPTPDPYRRPLPVWRQVRDGIEQRVAGLAARMRGE